MNRDLEAYQLEMNTLLGQYPSQQNITKIARRIENQEELIALNISCGRANRGRIENHASWVMRKIFDENPDLLLSFYEDILHWILSTESDSVRRNLLPLASMNLTAEQLASSEQLGKIYDACFKWIRNERYAIAVRANAMVFLVDVCQREPALASELIPIFEEINLNAVGGLKSCSAKQLAKLKLLAYS